MKIDVRNSFNELHPIVKLIFDILIIFIVFLVLLLFGSTILATTKGLKTSEFFEILKTSEDLDLIRISQAISSGALFLLPPLVVSLLYSKNMFNFYSLNKSAKLNSYVGVILLIIFSLPLVNALVLFNDGIHLPNFLGNFEEMLRSSGSKSKLLQQNLLSTASTQDFIFNLIVFAVLPAIGEELFFRGLFQKHISEWTKSPHAGILITAILFSAFHFQFSNFIPILFLGIVLGYLYEWSKSLWLSIFAHFSNNSMAVIISYIYFKKNNSLDTNIENFGANPDTFFFTILSFFFFGAVLYFIYKQEVRETSK